MLKRIASISLILCIIALSIIPVYAESLHDINKEKTTTGMRMEHLINRYNSLTEQDLKDIEENFNDISDHWGEPYICRLSALDIIAGYGNGKFGPNDTLLAAQYIKMLVMALGYTPEIPSGQPYWIPFVDIALNEDLIFDGEIKDYTKPLTRELAAAIAYRALMKYETEPENDWYDYNKSKIHDYALITDKYKHDVVMAYRTGIIVGNNNLFVPQDTLTRAQAAVIITKLIDKELRVESVPQESEYIRFKNPRFNEYFFGEGGYSEKEYALLPSDFPLYELYMVSKTLIEKKDLAGGYVTNLYAEKYKTLNTAAYYDEETANKFYLVNPALPTAYAGFTMHTNKVFIEPGKSDSLNDPNTGYLYSINTQLVEDYNNLLKPYIHEILKTLFEDDADEAIKLHDYYLNLALNRKDGEIKSYYLNNRKVTIRGGVGGLGGTGFRMEIWAKGAVKQ